MDLFLILLKASVLAAAVALALLVVSVLAILVAVKLRQKRALGTLAKMACPRCGEPFGRAAAVAAREAHVAECEELRRNNPGVKLRLSNIWTVRCRHCHATARFAPETMNLTSASP